MQLLFIFVYFMYNNFRYKMMFYQKFHICAVVMHHFNSLNWFTVYLPKLLYIKYDFDITKFKSHNKNNKLPP